MRVRNEKRLGELAVEGGHVTPAQVEEALRAQKQIAEVGCSKRLGEIFVEKGFVPKAEVDALLRLQWDQHQERYFGDFRIHEKLGEGGMGAVYRATAPDGGTLAIKILSRALSEKPEFVERFDRESRLALSVDHPHLVRAFDVGQIEGRQYLAMEFVPGPVLSDEIERVRQVPESRALEITRQVASGLAHIHAQGIVHRDVKPGNVILDSRADGAARLLDMGLARSMTDRSEQITLTGQILGTPDFMAPEQITGAPLDGRTDVYALGATLYTMITGKAPFAGRDDPQAVLMGHLSGTFRDPLELAPDTSDGAVHVLEKAMATEPADRYGSAEELIADIAAVLDGQAPKTRQLEPSQTMIRRVVVRGSRRRRSRGRRVSRTPAWLPLVAGGAVMAVLVLVLAVVGGGADPAEEGPAKVAEADPVPDRPGPDPQGTTPDPPAASAFKDPVWGVSLALPTGWRADAARSAGPLRAELRGPGSALVRLIVTSKLPPYLALPLDMIALADRARRPAAASSAATDRTVGALTWRHYTYTNTAGVAVGVWLHQSKSALYRLETVGCPEALEQALLASLRFDPDREARVRLGDDGVSAFGSRDGVMRLSHGERWFALDVEPGLVHLSLGQQHLYAFACTDSAVAAVRQAAGITPIKGARRTRIGAREGLFGAQTIEAGETLTHVFFAKQAGGVVGVAGKLPARGIIDGHVVAAWGVLASLEVTKIPAPVQRTAPPERAKTMYGFDVASWVPFEVTSVSTKSVTHAGRFMLTLMDHKVQNVTPFEIRSVLTKPGDSEVSLQTVAQGLYSEKSAFFHTYVFDGASRPFARAFIYRDKKWATREKNNPKSQWEYPGTGLIRGVYDGGSFTTFITWTQGLSLAAGAKSTLPVLDVESRKITRVDLVVGRQSQDRWLVSWKLGTGREGTLVLTRAGKLVSVRDGDRTFITKP